MKLMTPSPVKKQRLTRFARRFERLLLEVWQKKLWILTYSVAIATAYYGTVVGRGTEMEDPRADAQAELDKERGIADVERLMIISAKLQDGINAFQKCFNSFPIAVRPVLASSQDGTIKVTFDPSKVQEALSDAEQARQQLTSLIGRVKACRFETTMFPDLFKGYEDDLRDLQNLVLGYERILKVAKTGDSVAADNAAGEVIPLALKAVESSEALAQRSHDTNLQVTHANKDLAIKAERIEYMTSILTLRVLVFFLLVFLTVFLGVLAFKSRRLKKLYSPMLGGRPDLAKSQRERYASMRL